MRLRTVKNPNSLSGEGPAVGSRTAGPDRLRGWRRGRCYHAAVPMKITIAHSPDSDDAFMFYGLARGGVPTGGIEVQHVLFDIETLNRHAQEGRHEVTAIS